MCPRMAAEIRRWQSALNKFNSVAHFKPWIDAGQPDCRVADVSAENQPTARRRRRRTAAYHSRAGEVVRAITLSGTGRG